MKVHLFVYLFESPINSDLSFVRLITVQFGLEAPEVDMGPLFETQTITWCTQPNQLHIFKTQLNPSQPIAITP